MDDIKNRAGKLKELKIMPENDSFELFEEYARKKRTGGKKYRLWIYAAAAVLLSVFIVRNIPGNTDHSITDFCEGDLCLCDKSFEELQKKGYSFHEISVNKDCFENCSGCKTGKWYVSNELRGVIVQKSPYGDEIFRIRLTKDYKGKLPNGKYVNISKMQVEDLDKVLQPEIWFADNCSDYASFSQGNFRILFKSDDPVQSGLTSINNNKLSRISVEAIEIFNNCMTN